MKRKTIVIALGGNSLTKEKQIGTYRELTRNIRRTCRVLVLLTKEYNLIIVSGSGPQIGALLLQNELSKSRIPKMPLDVLDAELEGELGYLINQNLLNELRKNKIKKNIVTIITQVLVSKKDPAFKNPTKFIGSFYTKKQAQGLTKKGFIVKEDQGRGYRRVVSSPKPIKILELESIKKLVSQGNIVIAAGGGGIPVILDNKKNLKGVEAVIDKDLASSCLARSIKADIMLILTGIPKVAINFKKKNQRYLDKLNIKTALFYYKQGQFPPGSMGPKIEAAIDFVKSGKRKKIIITNPENAVNALKGKTGTLIVK